jgi:RNA polymerase sigma factor (TIGR02999 family)
MSNVTQILSAIEQGDPKAAEQLLPLIYDELRKLAARQMAQEAPGQTLQTTALVHEAYLRLVGADEAQRWDSRGHFFAAAAEAMRRILVENVRRKKPGSVVAGGNGSPWTRSTWLSLHRTTNCWRWMKLLAGSLPSDRLLPTWSSSAFLPG